MSLADGGKHSRVPAPADEDDDDQVLAPEGDKPGIDRWCEALDTRCYGREGSGCVGVLLPDRGLVKLVQKRGKRFASMGFNQGPYTYFYPEEALWLLDEGKLHLLRPNTAASSTAPSDSTAAHSDEEQGPSKRRRLEDGAPAAATSAAAAAPTTTWSAESDDEDEADDGDYDDEDESGAEEWEADEGGDAAAMASADYYSVQDAYMLLSSKLPFDHYLVYSQLRAASLVALRHQPLRSAASTTAASATSINTASGSLQPVYDVYARDGLTTFKISAPGPPDFYLLIARTDEELPHPDVLHRLQLGLAQHAQQALTAQRSKASRGSSSSSGGATAPQPQLKYAIVSHTTVTFFSINTVDLPPVVRAGSGKRG